MNTRVNSTLDKEWEVLLTEARNIGMTPEEIRRFLTGSQAGRNICVIEKTS